MKLPEPVERWQRRTTIVATLGPATSDLQTIRELIDAGVDVVRLNFSHGTQDSHARLYASVRRAERELGRPVAVMQDLAGPRSAWANCPAGRSSCRKASR